jgi:hypothetical protein
MARISKKVIQQIHFASVAEEVLREHCTPIPHIGFFADNPPEMWSEEEKVIFDIATQVEDDLKARILEILGVKE